MSLKSIPALFALSLVALATSAQAETERQLGAHAHGAAQLTLAAEHQTLVVSLDTPAYNLIGFEQAPATDAQREQVESALAKLAHADAVLDLPASAQCVLEAHSVEAANWAGLEAHDDEHHDDHDQDKHHDDHAQEHRDAHEHEDDHGHDDHADEHHRNPAHEDDHHDDHDHAESAHSDVLVEWTYRCENPDALSTVTVSAFEHFPNLTDLQVQYIGDDWQGGAQLTPASPRLTLN